eukprot:6376181-Prymnesium_polylepis.1
MMRGGFVHGLSDLPSSLWATSLRGPASIGHGPTGSTTYVPKGLVLAIVRVYCSRFCASGVIGSSEGDSGTHRSRARYSLAIRCLWHALSRA